MKRIIALILVIVLIGGCARQAYPSALREYIKVNKHPIGANILTIRYLEHIREGSSDREALIKARDDYYKMMKYLQENNPAHLNNRAMPKITTIWIP